MKRRTFTLFALAVLVSSAAAGSGQLKGSYVNSINYNMSPAVKGHYSTLVGQVVELPANYRGSGCVAKFSDLYSRQVEIRFYPSAGAAPTIGAPIKVEAAFLGSPGLIYNKIPRLVAKSWEAIPATPPAVTNPVQQIVPPSPQLPVVVPPVKHESGIPLFAWLIAGGLGAGLIAFAISKLSRKRQVISFNTGPNPGGNKSGQTRPIVIVTKDTRSKHRAMPAVLRVVSGVTEEEFEVPSSDTSLTVGRDPSCDIVLTNDSVSRLHAYLVPGPNGWSFVPFENPTNGAYYRTDGLATSIPLASSNPIELKPGMELILGEVILQFEGEADAWAEPIDASGKGMTL